jgi:metal-responsive CopG/Arc/MetJ family transcriptional regulator
MAQHTKTKWRMVRISISLSDDTFEKVERMRKAEGKTRSAFMRDVIIWYLAKVKNSLMLRKLHRNR